MTTTDLLPCPFCGGDAYTRQTIVNDDTMRVVNHDTMYAVFCTDCDASVPWHMKKEQAIAAWNRRVEPKVTVEIHHILTDAPKGKIVLKKDDES